MTLTVADSLMESDQTRHMAIKQGERWTATWWSGTTLDYNQAITAMTLAEQVAEGVPDDDSELWCVWADWAAELGLTAKEAVHMVKGEEGRDG